MRKFDDLPGRKYKTQEEGIAEWLKLCRTPEQNVPFSFVNVDYELIHQLRKELYKDKKWKAQ